MRRYASMQTMLWGLALALVSGSAWAGLDMDSGQWRLELSGLSGVHSGSTDRSGDFLMLGTVEYEIPASPRCTLGLRLLPLLLYNQSDEPSGGLFSGTRERRHAVGRRRRASRPFLYEEGHVSRLFRGGERRADWP